MENLNAVLYFNGDWFVKNASGPVKPRLTREEMLELFPGIDLPERPEGKMTRVAICGDMRLLEEPETHDGTNLFRHVRVDFGGNDGTAFLAFPWKAVPNADGGSHLEGVGAEAVSMLETLDGGNSVRIQALLAVDMSRLEPDGKGGWRSTNPFADETYRVKEVVSFLPVESPDATPTP